MFLFHLLREELQIYRVGHPSLQVDTLDLYLLEPPQP